MSAYALGRAIDTSFFANCVDIMGHFRPNYRSIVVKSDYFTSLDAHNINNCNIQGQNKQNTPISLWIRSILSLRGMI